MRILLTNDDGIDAPGLEALAKIAAELSSDVWVVAPDSNQSGKGHALSLHEPLRMRQLADRRYAVRGTPTDCVLMAVRHILADHPPDLVLSGVNRGANVAEDMTHSGTIAAAFEGTHIGIRSIALSQAFGPDRQMPRWHTAVAHGPALIDRLLAEAWGPKGTEPGQTGKGDGVLLNVNFPDREPEAVTGTRATRQGQRDTGQLGIDPRQDSWGDPYYWLVYQSRRGLSPQPDTDLAALAAGAISVTPLHLDLTHAAALKQLAAAFEA